MRWLFHRLKGVCTVEHTNCVYFCKTIARLNVLLTTESIYVNVNSLRMNSNYGGTPLLRTRRGTNSPRNRSQTSPTM